MDSRIPPIDQQHLVDLRRRLHTYPELKWDLPMTNKLVCDELDAIGIPYESGKYGQYSVVATINPEKAGYTQVTRAVLNPAKLESLGWRPGYDLRSGLTETFESCKN